MSNDQTKAVRKYAQFHRKDPTKVNAVDFEIPEQAQLLGSSLAIRYVSTKIDPTTGKPPRNGLQGYNHDHDSGVNVYVPKTNGDLHLVPLFITRAQALVQLGHCLGFEYEDEEGEHHDKVYGEYPHSISNLPGLYTTECGHALLVIRGHQKLLAVIWGGSLRVEARGIVG